MSSKSLLLVCAVTYSPLLGEEKKETKCRDAFDFPHNN